MIKIGIIGTGVGVTHAKIVAKTSGLEVAGLCGYQSDKTERLAKELDIPFWTTDYKKLLQQPVDVIVIATPNDLHCPMFLQALKYKKHLIVEKSAGVSPAEVERMIKAASEYDKVVVVDHELRFYPLFVKIRNLIQNRRLGDIVLVNMSYVHNLFSNPNYRFSWMNQKDRGGGQLQLIGTHLLDLVNYWLNFPKVTDINIKTRIAVSEIKDVNGNLQKVTAESVFTLSCRFGDTLFCASNSGQGFAYKGLSFGIHGTDGFLIFDEEQGLRASFEFGKIERLSSNPAVTETTESVFKVGMKYFWEGLAKRLTENNQKNTDPRFCSLAQEKVGQEIIHQQ